MAVELIMEIADLLSDYDLYTLTCVSRRMAKITCPIYLSRKKLEPRRNCGFFSFRKENLLALSAWRRSDISAPKLLFCWIDSDIRITTIQSEILYSVLNTASPQRRFNSIYMRLRPTTADNILEFIRAIDKSRCPNLTICVDSSGPDGSSPQGFPAGSIYKGFKTFTVLRSVTFQATMGKDHWVHFLNQVTAPSLESIEISGNPPLSAVTCFLRRHPHISTLRLRNIISKGWSRPQTRILQLPTLHTLSGPLPHVLLVLEAMFTPPSLSHLFIASVGNLSYGIWVDELLRCLTLCSGPLHLVIGFTPTNARIGSDARVGILARSYRKATRTNCVISLTINVQHLSEMAIVVRTHYHRRFVPLTHMKISGHLSALDAATRSPNGYMCAGAAYLC